MPMIDVYAATGTFNHNRELAKDLATAMMRWEGVPAISLFLDNTAAFVHDLPPDALSNAAGDSNYVRVQILTPVGVLNRDKQLGVMKEMTDIIASAAGDPSLTERTWVLITEASTTIHQCDRYLLPAFCEDGSRCNTPALRHDES